MFRFAMSPLQAILTLLCFDQTVIIHEMIARYGITYGCTMVVLIKLIINQSHIVKLSNIKIHKIAEL
jgi:hypothetical protein